MTSGLIFDIQRFSVKDGPGIRTTVFLKGCSLRCAWCHNPESIRPWPELMYFDRHCAHCGTCAQICPCHQMVDGHHQLDRSNCNLCGQCETVCPYDALRLAGKPWTVESVMSVVRKDKPYYQRSGGGLTLSGGEVMTQVDFARELLQAAHREGIHTAIDTAGHVPYASFEAVLDDVDLILYDIKLIDPARHAFYTGFDNSLILANARRLFQTGKPMHIRVPVIPGVNHDDQSMAEIQAFFAGQPSVRQFDFLPYHDLGLAKAASLFQR